VSFKPCEFSPTLQYTFRQMSSASQSPDLRRRFATGIMVLAAAAVPASLAWDFSWESTIGIDRVWAPPHVATYFSIALAALAALALLSRRSDAGLRIGRRYLPLGAGVTLWGSAAFVVGVVFDRWWQSAYGLAAGIWHPPQMLTATGFVSVIAGAWLCGIHWQQRGGASVALLVAGGSLLAIITTLSFPDIYANRQHSAPFYLLACGTYPMVLVALSIAGKSRFSASLGALLYTALLAALVWLLPLVPGSPQVSPIYHPRTTLLPPPFPLLLVAPAIVLDLLLRFSPGRRSGWGAAAEAGIAFWLIFGVAQWTFAAFLLSPAADCWFFAGGGRHWPFFLRIDPAAQSIFWSVPGQEMTATRTLAAAGLAVVAAWIGLGIGTWLKRVQR
jgi:hypothetical protein